MVFTTNKTPKGGATASHDDDLAEAIVDRILERGRLPRLDPEHGFEEHHQSRTSRPSITDDIPLCVQGPAPSFTHLARTAFSPVSLVSRAVRSR